jgi:hypothetical protein
MFVSLVVLSIVGPHCGKHRSRVKDVEIAFWTCRHLVRFFKDALNILSHDEIDLISSWESIS